MGSTFKQDSLRPKFGIESTIMLAVALMANVVYARGTILGEVTSDTANAVQTITRSATPVAGTFQLSFGVSVQYQTTVLAFGTTAAQLQAALEALPNIGKGNVTVGLAGQVYTVTYVGALAGKPQPDLIVVQNSLTSSVPAAVTLTVATTTAGVQKGSFGPYNDALTDGRQVAKAIVVDQLATGPNGAISKSAIAAGNEHRGTDTVVAVAVSGGIWKTSDLVGLDANGVADLGRLVQGTVSDGLLILR